MPRQMPTTLRPRTRAQARGGASSVTFQIGGHGSRCQRPLPNRPPTLQAFRFVLSRTRSVSTHGFHGSRSYLRRHGVQFRGARILYHNSTPHGQQPSKSPGKLSVRLDELYNEHPHFELSQILRQHTTEPRHGKISPRGTPHRPPHFAKSGGNRWARVDSV